MSSDLFNEHFKESYFLQTVIDSIEEGVIVQNRKGEIIAFNKTALEILSLSESQLLGKTSFDPTWNASFADGSPAPGEKHPVSITLKTGEPQHNVVLRIAIEGSIPKWISINSKMLEIGDDAVAIVTFSDITEIVNTNTSLDIEKAQRRISEKKFSNVFKYSSIGKAIIDLKGDVIEVNDSLCAMLGYNREEVLGCNYKIYCADDTELIHFKDYTEQMLNGEMKKFEMEIQCIRNDGSICWTSLTTSLVRDEKAIPQFFIAQMQEITALKQLNKSLEIQNKNLLKIQFALEKKIGQLKEFAGIITHDVRGPAHNIKKMLEMHEATEDPELKQASFEYLKKVSSDLTNNLNELIQILQIHLEKDIPVSDCRFEEVVDSVYLQMNETIERKNATIKTNFEVTNIFYPRVFLQSIVYNLLSNSLKYCLPDTPPKIEINTYEKDGATYFSIKDNGLGIDMKKFVHMLFKFQKSFHSGFESKGIGLYLIKNQIEDQGGTISAESEPNKGIIFTIRF
ncbi:MAG: PAS domain S-box protein [Sediminibacterium sp.]|nr:PAS domain S-box protein [Sediminibacterium sp.]